MQHGVELIGQKRSEVVTGSFGVGSVNDADPLLDQNLDLWCQGGP
jgi:hypothetical protein